MVEGVEGKADEPADGGGCDEEATSFFAEMRDEGLGGAYDAQEISIDLVGDLLIGGAFERAGDAIAGVIEYEVDGA